MDQFSQLLPDTFLPALEEHLDVNLTALARALPSYINRVYEVQATDKTFYVAKFYRPGRWPLRAIRDEHAFLADCAEIEIPVVCPCSLANGDTLGQLGNIPFAVFPRRAGRQFDIESDEAWTRAGMLLGRIHNAGSRTKAESRQTLDPSTTTRAYVDQLLNDGATEKWRQPFGDICSRIIDTVAPYFEGQETIRIHGDFHVGNILDRPDEGLLVIDFDDMMNGPPVQDFWLLLPERYPGCKHQLELLLGGYRQFRDFNPRAPLLIEGLRAMRMIYFTAWCAMQRNDA
ncbi:MAG: serine/threonine protein kinase, partial [Chitinivibrionales bacterium]|nr:serine/threonine protein kinase [Chitinivibrionales bacterium]MBD3395407.1 serine/threonine protein kinase [Chitinivibrionales bacterium]